MTTTGTTEQSSVTPQASVAAPTIAVRLVEARAFGNGVVLSTLRAPAFSQPARVMLVISVAPNASA